ncbi:Asp23/Gls24 family envelope stress response protein [Shimazuella sp. AN120528]|uniref:Asp23/Gls24 family envelope stress response protein n=1 Tax=Shimazuella soli TaxID=1892854 RepID=UPI001F113A13|nr:Asp23/Gls24 family envelope stress response protein [Shimazuella soli]MCH5584935.1 Asp23/Gls24 family envelope stress response protein [Shimazuella soli]
MSLQFSNKLGHINVANDVIATLAGVAALECYGLVGMASRSQLKDGITELLRRDNSSKGIEVHTDKDNVTIDMHIIVGYGTKISEVAKGVQSRVKYTLNELLGIQVEHVNIFIQGVRLVNED